VQSVEMSSKKKNGLGRGLGALIPTGNSLEDGRRVKNIPISALVASRMQPRTEFSPEALNDLSASIREHGVLQPILVRPHPDGIRYEIIAGERRFRASSKANLESIPCLVVDFSDEKALPVALVENLQREDLNPIEEAKGFLRLAEDQGYTQEQIAKVVGKDRATVANVMRLLKLPESVQEMVADSTLSMGHARALLAVKIPALIEELAYVVAKEGMSVRDVESLAQKTVQEGPEKKRAVVKTPKVEAAAEREIRRQLERRFGTKVDLNRSGDKGTITIHFSSTAQLNELLGFLKISI